MNLALLPSQNCVNLHQQKSQNQMPNRKQPKYNMNKLPKSLLHDLLICRILMPNSIPWTARPRPPPPPTAAPSPPQGTRGWTTPKWSPTPPLLAMYGRVRAREEPPQGRLHPHGRWWLVPVPAKPTPRPPRSCPPRGHRGFCRSKVLGPVSWRLLKRLMLQIQKVFLGNELPLFIKLYYSMILCLLQSWWKVFRGKTWRIR